MELGPHQPGNAALLSARGTLPFKGAHAEDFPSALQVNFVDLFRQWTKFFRKWTKNQPQCHLRQAIHESIEYWGWCQTLALLYTLCILNILIGIMAMQILSYQSQLLQTEYWAQTRRLDKACYKHCSAVQLPETLRLSPNFTRYFPSFLYLNAYIKLS